MRDFRSERKALGITAAGFARLSGTHEETVTGWGTQRGGKLQQVPAWAWVLIDLCAAFPGVLAWVRERS